MSFSKKDNISSFKKRHNFLKLGLFFRFKASNVPSGDFTLAKRSLDQVPRRVERGRQLMRGGVRYSTDGFIPNPIMNSDQSRSV